MPMSDVFQFYDNCIAMYENVPHTKMGEWEDHDCGTPLPYICKGPVSETNKKPDQAKCHISGVDEAFSPARDSCYFESEDKKTWEDAEADCMSKGGHLLSLQDWTEQNLAFSELNSEAAWIGISNVDVSSKAKYSACFQHFQSRIFSKMISTA